MRMRMNGKRCNWFGIACFEVQLHVIVTTLSSRKEVEVMRERVHVLVDGM